MNENCSFIKGYVWVSALLCWVATPHPAEPNHYEVLALHSCMTRVDEGWGAMKETKNVKTNKNLCWWNLKGCNKRNRKGTAGQGLPWQHKVVWRTSGGRRRCMLGWHHPWQCAMASIPSVSGPQLDICVRQGTLLMYKPRVKNWDAGRKEWHVDTKES